MTNDHNSREHVSDDLTIDVTPFDSSHAAQSVEIAARAFTVVAEDARPKDSPAFLAHIHGDANPAGRAWIAVARKFGRAVATVAAVPARFRTRAAREVIGYQIGTFVVDATVQRQGLGSRSLSELTKVLITLPDAFIYAYPNPRSQAPLDRLEYRRVAEIPTRIHLPGGRTLFAKRATSVADRAGNEWDLDVVRGDAAKAAVQAIDELEDEPPGFVRDRRYFLWRFFGPDSTDRYEFAVLRSRATKRSFVLALARHSFHGQRFTILVDAFPNVFTEHHALAIRAAQVAGRRSGAWFVYVNTSAQPTNGTPWSLRLPTARNPRPVQLMIYPVNNAISAEELGASLAMTADWNGF